MISTIKKTTAISFLLLSFFTHSSFSADAFNAPQTKNGFGAMLFFTEDLGFPKKFHDGGGDIRLDATTHVTVGKPFLMIVNFFGPGLNGAKEPQLAMDIMISKPDGTSYLNAEGAEVWAGKYNYSPSSFQLANSIVKITIDPGDPVGTYNVKVRIKDAIKEVEIALEKDFIVTK